MSLCVVVQVFGFEKHFLRGECNDDGQVDVADGSGLAPAVFSQLGKEARGATVIDPSSLAGELYKTEAGDPQLYRSIQAFALLGYPLYSSPCSVSSGRHRRLWYGAASTATACCASR